MNFPLAMLADLRRVVRRDRRVILVEHGSSDFGPLAAYQDLVHTQMAARIRGCSWNHDVIGQAQSAAVPSSWTESDFSERAVGGTLN